MARLPARENRRALPDSARLAPARGALIALNRAGEAQPGALSICHHRRLIMSDIADVATIRHLNDQLRQSLAGGVLVMTASVIALRCYSTGRVYTATFNSDVG